MHGKLVWEWLGAASAFHRGGPGSNSCLSWAVFLPLCLYHSSLLYFPSPSVGFLQPPGSEPYQMPQSPSPCSPPQMPQQFSGKMIKIAAAWELEGRQRGEWSWALAKADAALDLGRAERAFKDSVTPSGRKTKSRLVFFRGAEVDLSRKVRWLPRPHPWAAICLIGFIALSFVYFVFLFWIHHYIYHMRLRHEVLTSLLHLLFLWQLFFFFPPLGSVSKIGKCFLSLILDLFSTSLYVITYILSF